MEDVDKVKREQLFVKYSQNTRTRGYPLKIAGGRFKTNQRNYFFTQCIGNYNFIATGAGKGR